MQILRNLIMCMLSAVLAVGCANSQSKQKDMNTAAPKVLVAYFSATGTTQKMAQAIADATNGTLYEITPSPRYTSADLNWNDSKSRSTIEMKDPDCRPALAGEKIDASAYDVIFLGYPIWWDLAPRQVNTWIEQQKLEGKTVIPFATSGGSSIKGSEKDLKRLYPSVAWREGKLLNGSAASAASWSKSQL